MNTPRSTPQSRSDNLNASLLLAFGVICAMVGVALATERASATGGLFIIAAAIAFGALYIGSRSAKR